MSQLETLWDLRHHLDEVLTLTFILLKIVGVIDWRLTWLLSPLWITGFFVMVGVLLIVASDDFRRF